jgi:hemerythrin-like domain-containing protein
MMDRFDGTRRHAMRGGLALVGLGLVLPSGGFAAEKKGKGPGQEKEVGAVEDLMREHGVLRRALLVYREAATKLRAGGGTTAAALNRTAKLFRSFGEDYHEKKLEEAHIFPALRKTKGPAAAYPDMLTKQHDRGREITTYILSVTRRGGLGSGDVETLSHALETFVTMYQNHAAREDTIVFPAWKTAISQRQLTELGEKFEQIEKQQFGSDGYEDAVKQIADIEQMLGLSDLAQFTPRPPPKS